MRLQRVTHIFKSRMEEEDANLRLDPLEPTPFNLLIIEAKELGKKLANEVPQVVAQCLLV